MRRKRPAHSAREPDLGPALDQVMEEYMGFLRTADESVDPKAFGARHAAAKTALSHLEQLMKLSGAASEEAAAKLERYQALLGETRRDMSEEAETPTDDDGDAG